MTATDDIPVFGWAIEEFTVANRTESLKPLMAQLLPLVKPGLRVLDLCCGAGAAAFMLEDAGCRVIAVDQSSALLEMGRAEARARGSAVEFIQADVLEYEGETAAFDLVICLGNALLDFPPPRFPRFRELAYAALKPGGRLVLEIYDGIRRLQYDSEPPELVAHEAPERISRRFVGYDPAEGGYRAEAVNHTRGESHIYHGYIYTAPLIRLALEARFESEQSIQLKEGWFLELFSRWNDC
ncbi:class I SAM-dependent methyltransferase [bacterium]|nr:class I SAM-dependent methyltransferase [bacterium]